ncbi:hypothetical protein R1sor_010536 [Riccia sorocarpa]|uniref:Ig-like domain-containing protein n=1 Tax=Riccia sorocarpa TaxID=122646 RepID=A0ABD3I1W9_9MARC
MRQLIRSAARTKIVERETSGIIASSDEVVDARKIGLPASWEHWGRQSFAQDPVTSCYMMDELISMEDSGSDTLIPLSPPQSAERLLDDFAMENGDSKYDSQFSTNDADADPVDISEETSVDNPSADNVGGSSDVSKTESAVSAESGTRGSLTVSKISGSKVSTLSGKLSETTKKASPGSSSTKAVSKTTGSTNSTTSSSRPASPSPRTFLRSSSAAAAARRSSLGGHEISRLPGNFNGNITPSKSLSSVSSTTSGTKKRPSVSSSSPEMTSPVTPGGQTRSTSSTMSRAPSKSAGKEPRRASLGGLTSLATKPVPTRNELKKWASSTSFTKPTTITPATGTTLTTTRSPSVTSTPRTATPTRSTSSRTSTLTSTPARGSPSPARRSASVGPRTSPATKSTASSVAKSPTTPGTASKLSPSSNGTNPTRGKLSPAGSFSRRASDSHLAKVSPSNGDRSGVGPGKNHSPVIADRGPSMLTRRKSISGLESRDPRLLSLPAVDIKAGDDVRLELRGQKLRTMDSKLVNLTPKLEFVYLRDNKLSTLEGIEILKRLKVLDLSFNELKGNGFEALGNCKALQQLYLAGNQITSLSGLPQLPNLEFLSVAQNKIKSLAMASQPRLQVVAASKNKVSTFRGFPYMPALEHLRLEENPILDTPHVEAAFILLCGPTLKKFNDRDLSVEEQELAKCYPPSTSLCLRNGWELCGPEEAIESTLQFVSAEWSSSLPPGYRVKTAEVSSPREEDPCLCTFIFEKVDDSFEDTELSMKYQWFVGGKTAVEFVPIDGAVETEYWPRHEDVGNCLKVECTLVLGETEYPPVFAVSKPVAPGSGIPRVLSLEVEGDYVEGGVIKGSANVAWCGGTPSQGIVRWLRCVDDNTAMEIDGASEPEYQATIDDVNASLVFVYTPVTEEGNKGESRKFVTQTIQPAPPSVNNVQIVGDAMDGNVLTGYGRYFGGVEGLSKFEWLREDVESGQFKLVSRGNVDYQLGPEDVGLRMMFIYTPVNCEGKNGDPVSAISGKVILAPPMVSDLSLVGDLIEGNKVAISCTFSGGVEGSSRVQWFKARSPTLPADESSLEAISSSKVAKAFRVPLGAVGFYLVGKYTPVRSDGEIGVPVFIISETTVGVLPPSLNFLSITGDYCEGKTLSAQYGYVGGYEGNSEYCWFLHENENDSGMQILASVGRLEYEVTKFAVNKYISFRCTPVREDGVVGETRTAFGSEIIRPGNPKITSIRILGTPVEGEDLYIEKDYWGGDEGPSRIQWYLTRPDGTQREIKGETGSSYVVRPEDIDGLLCVSYEPVRMDGVRGPLAISPVVGPVLPSLPTCESLEICGDAIEGGTLSFEASYKGGERGVCRYQWYRLYPDGRELRLHNNEYLALTAEDIGCQIQFVFTPVRKDGMAGEPVGVTSDVVIEGDPEGRDLFVPECHEDVEAVPERVYFGGKEGPGEYSWYHTSSRPEGMQLPKDVKPLYNGMTYTPELADVGKYLLLRWVPVRSDGLRGQPLLACSRGPVMPARPAVYNVELREVSLGMFVGEGEYYGGYEGQSKLSWYRQTADGYQTLIPGATSKTYVVCDDDYTAKVMFGYTPVRSDGVVGDLVLSEPSPTIYPELPRIQKLVISGKAVEGEILTALEVIPKGDSQQRSWDKFKKEIKYSWSRSRSENEDADDFEPIALQRACTYKVRLEDVGFCMRCDCIVSDVFGRVAEPVSCVTPPVTPGLPRIDKLEVEGRGFHTSLYAVRGIYFGGREGNSTLQWFRAMAGSPDLIPISGEVGRMYEANVDDVGYRLVAVYTPVREDGVEGVPTSASTEPIQVEPDVAREVKGKLEVGKVKFEALRDRDRSPMKAQQQQGLGSLERRVLNVNTNRVKVVKPGSKTSFASTEIRGTYAPPFHVEVFRNDQHRVKFVIDSENEVDLMVQSRYIRDVIVLVAGAALVALKNLPTGGSSEEFG